MSAEQIIANFIKWCKGRYGLDDETGEMYEPEYGENVELDLVIKEFMSEQISETTTNDRYAFIFYFEDGGWNFLTFDKTGLDKYFSSDEDDHDNAWDYIDRFLENGGNLYEYNLPSYETLDEYAPDYEDLEKLEDKPIPEFDAYLKKDSQENNSEKKDKHSNKYAIEFNVGCSGYWYVILYKDGKQYESYQAEEDNYDNISEFIYTWLDSNSNYYTYNIPYNEFDKIFPDFWNDIEKLEDKIIPGLEQYLEKDE